ncbi:glycosyltransferase family 4 protein [Desulfobaculum sp. SPO524]|uniref:glycosyltransferase family 4 protein n=1 Tax=Desulfobaculum sp. SPO524 TaxID=3378071 RepID=UPI003851E6F4
MKVLLISSRADWGGGPEHVYQLVQNLPSQIVPYVACPLDDTPYAALFALKLGAHRVVHIPHRKFTLGALLHLLSFCRAERIELLHSHGAGGGGYSRLLSRLLRIPVVHTYHGIHVKSMRPVKKWLRVALEFILGKATTVGIAVSPSEAALIKKYNLIDADRISLIENGVVIPDESVVLSSSAPHRIIHITRFDPIKNTLFISDVLKSLQELGRNEEFVFELLGDGEERKRLHAALRLGGFDDQVVFHGFQKFPDSFFTGALCYFSCSLREGMPLSVLEAQAAGLPVVVSDVEGNNDLVNHETTGLLFSIDNADSAARQLCRLADNSLLASSCAERARANVETNHSVQKMAKCVALIYKKAML